MVIVSFLPFCRESKKEKQKKKVSIFLHFPLAECSKEERKKFVHLLSSLAENAKKKGEGEVRHSATPSSLE